MLTYIILGMTLAIAASFVLFNTKDGSVMTIDFSKALLLGFAKSDTVYEEEGETDHHFQVAIFFLVITVSWTTIDE